jgi:carbon monoxide dehydrogenase subunit G
MQVSTSIDIAAPPERVWDIVMDPDRLGEWVTIHRKVGKVHDRPLKQGSELEQTLGIGPARFKVWWTIADIEPNRRVTWNGEGPARSHASINYALKPDGNGGTRFEYRNDFDPPGGVVGAAASRALAGGVSRREAEKTLKRLKALAERG